MSMEIEYIPPERIIVKDRYRSDVGDLTDLIQSIKQKGILQPITINAHRRLVAGERRLRAAIEAGLEKVPCIVRPTSDRLDAMEVELMENLHRKDMPWPDVARLENAIYEHRRKLDPKWTVAQHAGMRGVSVGTVSNRLNLAQALQDIPELAQAETESDARKALSLLIETEARKVHAAKRPPEIVRAIERAGEHYVVGDALAELELVKAESFDFAEVDPPYGVRLDGHKNRSSEQRAGMSTYDEVSAKEYPAFLEKLVEGVYGALKLDTYAIFWYGFEWHCLLYELLVKNGFRVNPTPGVWYKMTSGSATQPDITLANCYEQFLVARKGQPKLAKPGRGNMFCFDPVPPAQKIHSTEKPIKLLQELLETFCFPGSRILCPFLGSGVTLRAAYGKGHTGMGWDASEQHRAAFLDQVEHDYRNRGHGEPKS